MPYQSRQRHNESLEESFNVVHRGVDADFEAYLPPRFHHVAQPVLPAVAERCSAVVNTDVM